MSKKRKKKVNKNDDYWLAKVRELQLRKNGVNERVEKKAKKKKHKPVKKVKRSYKEYLKSNTWKIKRDKVVKRANNWCEICKVNRAWQVHHKTYKRIFRERLSDLVATCETCHKAEHNLLTEEEIETAILHLIKSEGYE